MSFNWVEWFGYLASLVVLISLTMTSILKLRWINLLGCILFAIFAWLIDSLPTVFMNLGIACINLYFIYKIYTTREEFKILRAMPESEFFQHFLHVNRKEIEKQTAIDNLKADDCSFYMLRDNNIAGLLVGVLNGTVFDIKLDYVTPRYRDFKLGSYYYQQHPEFFKEKGINTLTARASDKEHQLYLQKVGFTPVSDAEPERYIKYL